MSPTEIVVLPPGPEWTASLATCLGQLYEACQPCEAGTKQHLCTGAQTGPPLEINTTYGGSAGLKSNIYFFNWVDPVNTGGGTVVCRLGSALRVCDGAPEWTSEEVV